jgi:hypothetical protein
MFATNCEKLHQIVQVINSRFPSCQNIVPVLVQLDKQRVRKVGKGLFCRQCPVCTSSLSWSQGYIWFWASLNTPHLWSILESLVCTFALVPPYKQADPLQLHVRDTYQRNVQLTM